MRISKRTREQAAMICAVSASDGSPRPDRDCYDLVAGRLWPRPPKHAVNLALAAWDHVRDMECPTGAVYVSWTAATDADAEALLRTGWEP